MLIKKALPAMGLFTKGAAEQANIAAQNARDYTDGLRATTSAQVIEDNKKLESSRKRLEEQRRGELVFNKQVGPKSQEKGAAALDRQFKKKYKGRQRLGILIKKEAQLERQIAASGEKSSALLKQDLANLQKEKANLVEQVRLTDQIADNEERGAVAIHKKSLAAKRQLKLDRKAGIAGSVAGIAGTAETQGTMAAFREMRLQTKGTFDHIDEAGDSVPKSFGFMSKSIIRAKGSVAILTTGINKLMMALGPIMMAFALLSPLLMMFTKWLGFGNEESKKLDETLGKVQDRLKNFDHFRYNK